MLTPEQQDATYKGGTNILVSAAAGSGKTRVLSERVLRKVKEECDIDNLLILTFTKAAANSMKEKIREKLKEALLDNPKLKEQLDLLDKAYITTFDSFTSSIVKKYHDRLNINRDFNIIDTNSIKIYKKQALDEIFLEYYEKNDTLFNKLITDFCLKNDKTLKKEILSLNDKLDLKYDKTTYLENYITNFYSEEYIANVSKEFYDLINYYVSKIKEEVKNMEYILDTDLMEPILKALDNLLKAKDYKEIKNSLDFTLPAFRGKKYEDSKESKNNIDYYLKILREKLCVIDANNIISNYESTKDYLEVIINILLELDKKIAIFKLKNNSYEYNDISKLAIKLVKENTDIKEELRESFDEIMIDEYQDTSDLQEDFIQEIAKNNTYMVGDIKQSIYRFRNANPDIFKQKYIKYSKNIDGIKIDLNKNFRSRRENLVDINTIFDKVMDLDYGGADYINGHRMVFGNEAYCNVGKTNQNYNLEIYNYTILKNSKYQEYKNNEIEAFIIAKDIKDKIESKYKIFDKDNNILRDIKYSDFSIIIDKSKSFDTYKKIFEYFNIPLTVYKDINIADSFEFYLIKNILKLLDKYKNNEIDDVFKYSFVSVARSYLFRLSDEEIYNIVNNGSYLDTEIIKKIAIISDCVNNLDLKNLIIRIKEVFEFDSKIITIGSVNVRIATLEYLIKLASDLMNMDYDYHMFIDYLDLVYEDVNARIDIPVSVVSENSVKIMTIHASKGLEYHVCYFPEVSNEFNMQDLNSKILYDSKYGITLPSYVDGYSDTITKILAKRKFIKEEVSEKIRLFYVALTRVKEKMIIITSISKDDVKNKEDFRSFKDIINSVKEDLLEYIKEIDLDDLKISRDYVSMVVGKLPEYSKQELNVKEYLYNTKIEEDKHFSKEIKNLLDKDTLDNMNYGRRIHELFEIIDFKKVELDKLDITSKEKEYITNFLKQDILKDIAKANILKEYEFYDDNKHGIIDLMLEYSDHIDIIDYKLKHVDDNDYLKQLNGYREYIEAKTKKSVNIYLYSIVDNIMKKI